MNHICSSTCSCPKKIFTYQITSNSELESDTEPKSYELGIYLGDITKSSSPVIVNAANSSLSHGGGLAGAIIRAFGESVQEKSDKKLEKWEEEGKSLLVGDAVYISLDRSAITNPAYRDTAIVGIIHAVGPNCHVDEEAENYEKLVRKCILKILRLAEWHQFNSIAIPPISTGIFACYPKTTVEIILQTCIDFFNDSSRPHQYLKDIRFTDMANKGFNGVELINAFAIPFLKNLENLKSSGKPFPT